MSGDALPLASMPANVNLPAAVGRLGEVAHAGVREEFRTVAHRIRQIGESDGVLGADVAAAAAIAAARAARLLDAGDIDVGIEADGHRRRDDVVAERGAGSLQRPVLRVPGGARIALRLQPAPRAAEALIEQAVLRHLAGPALVGEDARIRAQRHAGVDQRPAAETAADEHVHVLAEPHVEERRRRAGAQPLARHLHLVLEVGEAGGELPGQHLAAALQHGHLLAGAGKARGGHAAAVARADDDDVVAVADELERARQAGHCPVPGQVAVVDGQLTDFSRPNYGAAARLESKIATSTRRRANAAYPSHRQRAL